MGFFSRLFGKKKKETPKPETSDKNNHLVKSIEEIESAIKGLGFVSQKEYLDILEKYRHLKDQIAAVKNAGMLEEYCIKNNVTGSDIDLFLSFFNSSSYRNKHNEDFIIREKTENKDYLEHILDDCDPHIRLDDEQMKVVISDEDNTLVIAGAGAGKTTTVAAKVKYLVDKKGIDPKEILVISFTNKAVDELKERINQKLKIAAKISTFHRVGFDLINDSVDKKTVKEEGFLAACVRDYLKTKILTDKNMASKILLFFASYLNLPPHFDMPLDEFFDYASRNEFNTMRGDLKAYAEQISSQREKTQRTIKNERVASYQELQIANFLFINGIEYKYEDPYKFHIEGSHKIYLPDFHIFQDGKEAYLEHFGMISDKGTNSSRSQAEIDKYLKAIKDKIQLHKQHGTTLLKTFGGYSDGRDIVEHLKEELVKHGFKLNQRPEEEILSQVISTEQNKYIGKLIKLVTSFIEAFKTNGYNAGHFKMLKRKTNNERDKLFLDIVEGTYNYYQNDLKINYAIDFSDMINDSVEIIKNMQENNEKIPYKYIIVDEYQDISHQRYNLTKELSKIADAKIMAVGDDWQSIYAFSGSDITLFTEFKKCILDPRLGCVELAINNTYRNAQELINIAGEFVQRNVTQLPKTLRSPKNLKDPVIIYSYCDDDKKIEDEGLRNSRFQRANTLEAILDKLVSEDPSILNREKGKEPILLIGRFGFDAEHLAVGNLKEDFFGRKETETEPYNIFDYCEESRRVVSKKYPTLRMAFMTAHSSKGLTYDNVIIINGLNGTNGFPSKKEDDPVMDLVIKRDRAIEYAEERRLFYVALTRTSNRVYIIAPETRPSEFVTELIKDKGYKNITVKGVFNERFEKKDVYYCPDCGFPLKYYGSTTIGIPLYICSNEHELCGFMSNDIKGGRLRIRECGECINGYMIVKKKTNADEHFLGCTNYTKDGKGCNHTISIQEFERLYPRTGIVKQYKPEDLANREALKYQGEKIEHLNTGKAVQQAQALKQAETAEIESKHEPKTVDPEREKQIEEQKNNEYVLKIRQKCSDYSKHITEKYSSKRNAFAYVKKGRSWYWFTIELDHLVFSFRTVRTEEFYSMAIDEAHIGKILDTIDLLIRDYYKAPKNQENSIDESQFMDNDFLLLVDAIKDHCLSYANLVELKEKKKRISYTKKGKSAPWFWVDITLKTFFYRAITLNDKPNSVVLTKESLNDVLAIIDDLIKNHYGNTKTTKTTLVSSGTPEQIKIVNDFIKWVTSNYDHILYLKLYGVNQFSLKGKNATALFWFALEDGELCFKYRFQTAERETPKQMMVDLEDTTELYNLAKQIIESNKNS